ncbi:MAG: hypothetical protein Kow00127_21900 [Bacteroidales bacterium]
MNVINNPGGGHPEIEGGILRIPAAATASDISGRLVTPDMLHAIQNFQPRQKSGKAVKFQIPLKAAFDTGELPFYTITAYFDHDTLFPGHLKDYHCGGITYDLSDGFNHTGTDFFPWPWPWKRMDANELEVVAAASGVLFYKQDGNFDRHCELNNDPWNGCVILHSDGSTSWYVHLKENSLTQKNVGEMIEEGEYLGVVGSSGSSLAPHLHFEVYDSEGNLLDPFEGPCNSTINGSMWAQQPPYLQPAINRVETHRKLPVTDNCPDAEELFQADTFAQGDTIFFTVWMKNLHPGTALTFRLLKPDQTEYASWNWNYPSDTLTAAWVYYFTLLQNSSFGWWNVEVSMNNETVAKPFYFTLKQGYDNNIKRRNQFTIRCENSNLILDSDEIPEKIEIISTEGLTVLSRRHPNKHAEINLAGLPSGLYVVRVYTKHSSGSRKIFLKH